MSDTEGTTKLTKGRITALTKDESIKAQGLELADGEDAERFRTLIQIRSGLKAFAQKHLIKEARIHAVRCIRIIGEQLEIYQDELRRLESLKPAESADNESLSAASVQLSREMAALASLWCPIKMPKPFKDMHMPVNDKDHKNNEDGLAAIQADLGPLWKVELYPEDDESDT